MVSLFDTATLVTFVLSSLALVVAPGPGQALVLSRTLQGGTRAGLLTALGLEIGTVVHTFAAALGLSAVLTTSATAFSVVKYMGATYLVFLGVQALVASHRRPDTAMLPTPSTPTTHVLFRAALTGLLNPKVAFFFLAFLPQFVNPDRGHTLVQFLLLGFGFAMLGLLGDGLLALAAGKARQRFLAAPVWARWRERVTGLVLIGLGIRLAALSRQ